MPLKRSKTGHSETDRCRDKHQVRDDHGNVISNGIGNPLAILWEWEWEGVGKTVPVGNKSQEQCKRYIIWNIILESLVISEVKLHAFQNFCFSDWCPLFCFSTVGCLHLH